MYEVASLNVSILESLRFGGSVGMSVLRILKAELTLMVRSLSLALASILLFGSARILLVFLSPDCWSEEELDCESE